MREHACATCAARFATRADLIGHVRHVHERVDAEICVLCGRMLANHKSLRAHVASVHSGVGVQKQTCVSQHKIILCVPGTTVRV
jgi:hypothetical protein